MSSLGMYWTSAALMWLITAVAYAWMRHWRRQLQAATLRIQQQMHQGVRDAPLAEWCRHMSLTVVTVSGAVFSTTLAELQTSEAPTYRSWNVPTQVVIWSDEADDKLTADVRETAALDGLDG